MSSVYHNLTNIFRGYPVTNEPKLEEVQCLMTVDSFVELYSGMYVYKGHPFLTWWDVELFILRGLELWIVLRD